MSDPIESGDYGQSLASTSASAEVSASAAAEVEASASGEPKAFVSASSSFERSSHHDKYRCEWQQLTLGADEVRRRALTGVMRTSRMRSLAWSILLDILPLDSKDWLNTICENRDRYNSLKEKYVYNLQDIDYKVDNPLSQSDESKWNQYFQDQELQSTIKLDVIRTFPGVEIFKQMDIRNAMINILFIYAKEMPDLLYRQGMHEILAPILFVLHSDHRAAEHVSVEGDLVEIMNPEFIEHDAYIIFEAMMVSMKKFYTIHERTTILSPNPSTSNANNSGKKVVESEIVRYLRLLNEKILSVHDPELAEFFVKLDVSLTVFGVRWLRVLFGREFPLQDVLVLWDIILAEGDDFSLAGCILVSMLISIRTQVLKTDLSGCMTVLLNYPTIVDIQYIIDLALYLKNPELYCKPSPRIFNFPILPPRIAATRKPVRKTVPAKNKRNITNKLKIASTAEENIVVDGDILQDTSLLREELSEAYRLMSDCSLRLTQYENILRRRISTTIPNNDPLHTTLNDIKELCLIMRPKYEPIDVEPALEANDFQYAHKKVPKQVDPSPAAKSHVPNVTLPKEVPLKLIRIKTEVSDDSRFPYASPFHVQSS